MPTPIVGLHHVTAIAGDPQADVEFHTSVLGLRLVKRTVNFDAPDTYHLYYGDEVGHPGTILTFFPWPGASKGRRGTGQVTVTSFSIPESATDYWRDRLTRLAIGVDGGASSPVASMPPTSLAALPSLPPQLEYRVVVGGLLLIDGNTRRVIDILPAVLPLAR